MVHEKEELTPIEKALAEVRKHPSSATVSFEHIIKILELLSGK